MPAPKGLAEDQQPFDRKTGELRSVSHTRLKIDSAGRIVIPAEMRAAMNAKPGDVLTAEVVDGELRIMSRSGIHARLHEHAEKSKSLHPGSAVDELIADRREDARREDEKFERLEHEAANVTRGGKSAT